VEWIERRWLRKHSKIKPEGRRRVGKPRLRWLEDVVNDLWSLNKKYAGIR
jgi:hypothetical protein